MSPVDITTQLGLRQPITFVAGFDRPNLRCSCGGREVRGLKLILAYDGTAFDGWQRQPGRRTVQGVVEEKLRVVLGEEVTVTGAGRTDAGCHARGQVASFATRSALPAHAFAPVLNQRLPADLRVRSASEVGGEFDARRSAIGRRYAYRLLREEDLLFARIAWHPRRPLDDVALARAVAPLEGEHDCASFQCTGSTPVAVNFTGSDPDRPAG